MVCLCQGFSVCTICKVQTCWGQRTGTNYGGVPSVSPQVHVKLHHDWPPTIVKYTIIHIPCCLISIYPVQLGSPTQLYFLFLFFFYSSNTFQDSFSVWSWRLENTGVKCICVNSTRLFFPFFFFPCFYFVDVFFFFKLFSLASDFKLFTQWRGKLHNRQ